MYIMKRPSHGRGEYELAQRLGSVHPHDLVDREFELRLGSFGWRRTGITLKEQGGKLRLRLTGTAGIHLARQVEAALMLPKSIRDEDELPDGQPVVMRDRYLMRRMLVRSVDFPETGKARIELATLELANRSHLAEEIDVEHRIGRVRHIHEAKSRLPTRLAELIADHERYLASPDPIPQRAEATIRRLMDEVAEAATDYDLDYVPGTDVVPVLLEMADAQGIDRPTPMDEIAPEEVQVRRRQARKFQHYVNARGAATAHFRRLVRDAYDYRCVVSGLRLPKNAYCRVPGIDAAHILPWAEYDLDVVRNGLCLSKLYHWAYDQGLITVACADDGRYSLHVTKTAVGTFAEDPASLEAFKERAGEISADRLPRNPEDRPSPQFLKKRDEDLGIEIVDA